MEEDETNIASTVKAKNSLHEDDPEAEPQPETTKSTNKRKPAEWFDIDDEHNTYVYVSGLPANMEEDEFIELMKRYGIIAKKNGPSNPYNVKLYRNADGTFKGEALCRFVRRESVELALNHLDDYQYDAKHTVKCERAKFQLKGNYDPSKKPRVDPKTKEKHKKVAEKLLSWDTDESSQNHQKVVILKYMFTPEEIEEDVSLLLGLKEDVELKCSELLGFEPKKIVIHDKHPEGVITTVLADFCQAQACVGALNDQYYAGRKVKAEIWDGKTNYTIKETDEEAEKRLEKLKQDVQKSDKPNSTTAND